MRLADPLPPRPARARARLSAILTCLASGRPAVVTVGGPPGSGQHALLRWAAASALHRGIPVRTLGPGAASTTMPPDDTAEPGRMPTATQDGPVLYVAENVRATDQDTARRLAELAEEVHALPVALMMSFDGSPAALPPVLATALAGPAAPLRTDVVLPPLDAPAAAALVEQVCGTPGDEPFVTAATRLTRGNPAVLEEALRRLVQGGRAPHATALPEFTAAAEAALADHVARVLDRLPAGHAAALRALAAAGALGLPAVCRLAGLPADDETAVRAVLEGTGLTTPALQPPGLDAAVRTHVLACTPAAERTALHVRAAELAHTTGAGAETVAALLLDTPPLAHPWVLPALRGGLAAARRAGDHPRTAALLARMLAEPLPPAEHGEVTLHLAAVEAVTAPTAGDRRLARLLHDTDTHGTGTQGTGTQDAGTHGTGTHETGTQDADTQDAGTQGTGTEETSAEETGAPLPLRAADLALARGGTDLVREAVADARATARGARRDGLLALLWAEAAGDGDDAAGGEPLPPQPRGAAQAAVRAWHLAADGTDRATALRLARTRPAPADDTGALLLPRLAACRALVLADELDEAESALDALLARTRRHHLPAGTARVLAARAELHLRRGRLADAEGDIAECERALPPGSRHAGAAAHPMALRILVDLENGHRSRARALAAAPAPPGPRTGTPWAYLLFARALEAAADARIPEAAELFEETGRHLVRRRAGNPALLPWRSLAARAHQTLGDPARARALVTEELQLARKWGAPTAVAWAELHTGRLAKTDRTARMRQAVAALRESPAGLAHAWALADLAALELRGPGEDWHTTAPWASELSALITAHPCSRLAATVRELTEAQRTPAPRATARLREWTSLTQAELHTATLAGRGHGNRHIAELLAVSRRTVELRLSSVYRKLGITGRTELCALVRGMGE
ncbi:LuxR C-terminal-related transcriptional regulator [Streptomyces sp. NPDC049585]|uniref:helix-turn-helix transcriptional regulator n=1 Tax=Streptomyces sp. NPDC049585 TaxID=3155154 RepID=UPI0034342255